MDNVPNQLPLFLFIPMINCCSDKKDEKKSSNLLLMGHQKNSNKNILIKEIAKK